ncbi:MAG TPA: ABC transporter permease [Candidatus Nanopelagicales bacterium]|nr:ABC transporter permease [Candidatus Nanopelagicales bacterium]
MSLAVVVMERNVVTYRRQWIAFLTGFLEPVFYLFSLGIGLGALVGDLTLPDGRAVSYAQFVAPGMLALSAMNGAVFDSTYNMFFKLKHMHTFEAMLATPVGPRDIALGEMLWSLVRSGIYVTGFLLISVAMGLTTSWWALLAVPAATLIGFVFSGMGMAATTWVRNFQDFDYIQMVLVPLTLLSATFFPVEAYPEHVRWLVQLSPLYHGVVIERGLMLGDVGPVLLVHAAVLVLAGVIGLRVARRRLAVLLLT